MSTGYLNNSHTQLQGNETQIRGDFRSVVPPSSRSFSIGTHTHAGRLFAYARMTGLHSLRQAIASHQQTDVEKKRAQVCTTVEHISDCFSADFRYALSHDRKTPHNIKSLCCFAFDVSTEQQQQQNDHDYNPPSETDGITHTHSFP